MIKHKKNNRGFTLLEILLVVAALGILAGIVILAINPGKQLADTRNAQRKVDVNTILNGVYQYAIDSNGVLPTAITAIATEAAVCTTAAGQICTTGGTCTGLTDLAVVTASGVYLTAIPKDPQTATANGTGYQIGKLPTGRVTVCAPGMEPSTAPDYYVTR
ncbi:MAG: type II secretion system protein [Patescibacteria group bacterium]